MTIPMGLLPEHATSPVRGVARKPKKAAQIILTYALEHGGRIEKTPEILEELLLRGFAKTPELVDKRLPNAISDLKKYYGLVVTTERMGRDVTAYIIAALVPSPSAELV